MDEAGFRSAELNEAIPFAADVVQHWSNHCKLVYLTGRTENTRDITLGELRKFGFPIKGAELIMFSLGDFARARGLDPSGPTLVDARARLLSAICETHDVVRAVDDYPGYFPAYKQFKIPDRIACCVQGGIHCRTTSREAPQESSGIGKRWNTPCLTIEASA